MHAVPTCNFKKYIQISKSSENIPLKRNFYAHKDRGRNLQNLTIFRLVHVDNVNEYLKLASNADKHQLQRIKAVFEKKNQKYAQTISQLQKKLESYNRRLQDLEAHGVSNHYRQPREVLRDMSQGLK